MRKIITSNYFWVACGIMVASIIIGFLLIKNLPSMPVVSDSMDYHTIATSILQLASYTTISDQLLIYPPLYPIFLALVYAISHVGAYTIVYFIQYLLVGITSILVFFILKNYFQVRTWLAVLGAGLVLFWPYFVLYSQIISSEILYIFLLTSFFGVLLRLTQTSPGSLTRTTLSTNVERVPQLILLAGILLGLAILTRPVALLLLPWIIIGGWILQKTFKVPEQPLPYKKYFLVLLVALATLTPWEIYVYAKYQRVIPVASNLSAVFNKANKNFGYLSESSTPKEFSTKTLLGAKIKNVYLFWNPGANGYHLDIITEKYPVVRMGIITYKIGFFALLFLAFLAVLWFCKRTNVLLAVLVIGYFWALHTVLFPFPRYMMPVIPFIIILAMMAVSELLSRYGNNFKTSYLHTGEK